MAKSKRAKIKFIGQSAEQVAGSSYLVEYDDEVTMLDFGLIQCENKLKQWTLNNANFKFKVKSINNLIISHQHGDHGLAIPRLYANGCNAKIFIPKNTRQYYRRAFMDGLKIQIADCELLSKQYGKNFKMPYTEEDIDKAINHMVECEENSIIRIGNYMSFRFSSAYHIAKSMQVELFINDKNYNKKIVYSGDLGNTNIKKPFLEPFVPIKKCDILLGETTYAMNMKSVNEKTRAKDREKIKTVVRETCIEKNGKTILASFSMQRLQELMYEFYTLYKDDENFDTKIVIDTPLGIDICNMFTDLIPYCDYELWYDIMNWENFVFIKDWEDSVSCMKSSLPMVIITASGFCNGGRIRSYLQDNLGDDKNTILFVGYSSPDSLAGIIKEGKKKAIEIDGITVKNKAKCVNLLSFSSHMQHNELLKYYSDMNCREVYLVHGEKINQYPFAELLMEEYKKQCKTTKVFVPNIGDEIFV